MEPISPEQVDALCKGMPRPDPASARRVLPEVARNWLRPEDPFRKRAIASIGKTTGYAAGLIASGLDHMMTEIAENLVPLVDLDLPVGWTQRPNLRCRWEPPRLLLCIFAGNVPGVPAPDIAGALCIGTPVLCKVAHNEPHFGPLFVESIAAVDPLLAKSAAAVYWPGSSYDHLKAALRYAEAVVAYGGDESLSAVRQHVKPGLPFLGYGHRLSLAVVDDRVADAASRVAIDVANFDQQGCVAPHVIYVRGDAHAFSIELAKQLEHLQQLHPRSPATMEEAVAIRRARDEAEFKDGAELYCSDDTAWTVIYDAVDRTFVPSPLGRTVRVHPVRDFDELPALVSNVRRYLQTCGFAGTRDDAELLARTLGVTRICPVGRAQYTRITWNHDGQPKLSRLVRWVDIEDGVGDIVQASP
jgi:acyl-CoA reductase-like NAD-dependent aldehyde dehydrogenase